jgi:outer membrane biosynthesis protein TonB
MLTSIGQAAVRRMLTRPAPTVSSSAAPWALTYRPLVPARSFTLSVPAREAAAKPKKAATKTPKATKAATEKTIKKAAKPKKKTVSASSKPTKAPKVVLTKEQKAAARQTAKLKQLKEEALIGQQPNHGANNSTTWLTFLTPHLSERGNKIKMGSDEHKALAETYKNLSASEMAVSL